MAMYNIFHARGRSVVDLCHINKRPFFRLQEHPLSLTCSDHSSVKMDLDRVRSTPRFAVYKGNVQLW